MNAMDTSDLPPPERSVRVASGGVLHPVTAGSERARALARRSVAAREAKRAALRADTEAVASHLRRIINAYPREQLGPAAAALALDLIGRVARGEVKVRHAQDASELIRTLVDVTRLEGGEPTSAAVVAHVDSATVAARVAQLQAQARAALGVFVSDNPTTPHEHSGEPA
jgi:hypothetical protein